MNATTENRITRGLLLGTAVLLLMQFVGTALSDRAEQDAVDARAAYEAEQYRVATQTVQQLGCYDAPPPNAYAATYEGWWAVISNPFTTTTREVVIIADGNEALAAYDQMTGRTDYGLTIWGWCAPDEDDIHDSAAPVETGRAAA